jgi:hypothetical protein
VKAKPQVKESGGLCSRDLFLQSDFQGWEHPRNVVRVECCEDVPNLGSRTGEINHGSTDHRSPSLVQNVCPRYDANPMPLGAFELELTI